MNEQNHEQRIADLEAKVKELSTRIAETNARALRFWNVQLNIFARSSVDSLGRIQDTRNLVIALQRIISKSRMVPDEDRQELLRLVALAESAAEKCEAEIAAAKAMLNSASLPPPGTGCEPPS